MPVRVLLVEDSPSTRSFVAGVLAGGGIADVSDVIDVRQVASGFAALQVLPGGNFDLIITDVNMPDVSGLELLRFVRGAPALRGLPVVVISTEGRDRDRERCLALGADVFLTKPFTPEALLAAVHTALGAKRD